MRAPKLPHSLDWFYCVYFRSEEKLGHASFIELFSNFHLALEEAFPPPNSQQWEHKQGYHGVVHPNWQAQVKTGKENNKKLFFKTIQLTGKINNQPFWSLFSLVYNKTYEWTLCFSIFHKRLRFMHTPFVCSWGKARSLQLFWITPKTVSQSLLMLTVLFALVFWCVKNQKMCEKMSL